MFSKNKGLAKTNSKELLLNKSGVNSGGKGTEREESMAGNGTKLSKLKSNIV